MRLFPSPKPNTLSKVHSGNPNSNSRPLAYSPCAGKIVPLEGHSEQSSADAYSSPWTRLTPAPEFRDTSLPKSDQKGLLSRQISALEVTRDAPVYKATPQDEGGRAQRQSPRVACTEVCVCQRPFKKARAKRSISFFIRPKARASLEDTKERASGFQETPKGPLLTPPSTRNWRKDAKGSIPGASRERAARSSGVAVNATNAKRGYNSSIRSGRDLVAYQAEIYISQLDDLAQAGTCA